MEYIILILIILVFVQQTIVPSVLQLSAMATQMLTISPQLSLISAFVRKWCINIYIYIYA